ncbi:winged helix-turn-helix transcriptional regulator [Erythrobacter sp. NE805]|uniref:winged helix-turn-helix transcriptional regulator n=1 Tax=Erythrobacter sp. NE805 TaxID=3389875 RepID=UPI00396B24B8
MSNPASSDPVVRAAPVPRDRCGMALACEMLGDRWTMLVIREAFYGVTRFDDLRSDLGAPRGILSARLKALVTAGVLERHPYREGKARVRHEYRLTQRGQELALPLIALMEWGDRHLQDAPSPLQIYSKASGAPLRVALVTPEGQAVPREDVTYAVAEDPIISV